MRGLSLLFILTGIMSCQTRQSGMSEPPVDTTTVNRADTPTISTDTHYFWSSEWDKKGLVMKKYSQISPDSLNPASLIQKLNTIYPQIRLHFIKISNDSIFVRISRSRYLTQQMGSSGADAYLAEVTYNLTELRNINFVNMQFKQGDHASPGTYTRTDFIETKN